jgi:H+/Cl- antiporter ClcA
VSAGSEPGAEVAALTRSPGFWVIVKYAILFGVVLPFAALAFLGLVKGGTNAWFTLPKNPGWFDGHLWWVGVTAGAGVLVGLVRRVFGLAPKLPGTIEDIKAEHVEPATVPGKVAVSVLSLAGGASLGPEAALGTMGGGSEPGSPSGTNSTRTSGRRTLSPGCPGPTVPCCRPPTWRRC